jgi:predicted nucleotidyltransferase
VGLKRDLEDLLGVTVDIGPERGLHWFIRGKVLREALAGTRSLAVPSTKTR